MGRELFDGNPCFRGVLLRLEQRFRDATGRSLVSELYGPGRSVGDGFDELEVTHPALFSVECALAEAVAERGLRAEAVLGASLGNFAAAVVAGGLPMEQAFDAVLDQARCLSQHAEPGGMVAVFGSPDEHLTAFESAGATLAARNFAQHFVLSVSQVNRSRVEALLRSKQLTAQWLPVRYAFHAAGIDLAATPYRATLERLPSLRTDLPLWSCDADAARRQLPGSFFWDVVRQPIRFADTIATLEQLGPWNYVDLGPAGTLATFIKYALPPTSASRRHAVLSPFGGDARNLDALVASALR
jgi:acyl transferase domain-containing protein